MKNTRALVLLSGGLDSMLAAKILIEQGVEVTGITFVSHFFGAINARRAAKQLGVKLIEYDFKDEHLSMVKRPAHGYGSNMNPCIDCHALMLLKARELMETEHYDFIATGEVLGQRPMSQNKDALQLVAKISGLTGRLLRPLSAKLLDLTEAEKLGKIRREELLTISGRSRKRQVELAASYGLKDYPSPAGGCLLTDPAFGQRLGDLFRNWPDCTGGDIEIIKFGRVHWLIGTDGKKTLAVIGRDEKENKILDKLARAEDTIIELTDLNGPTTLLRNFQTDPKSPPASPAIAWRAGKIENPNFIEVKIPKDLDKKIFIKENILEVAVLLTGYYSPKARGKSVKAAYRRIE